MRRRTREPSAPLLLVLLALLGAACGAEPAEAGARFWCPMDPSVERAQPGDCPICSMELVRRGAGASRNDGAIRLTGRQIQQAGVSLARAEVLDLAREIETTGFVEVDPGRRRSVVCAFPGETRIERLHVHAVGDVVRAGEVLAEVHNLEALRLLQQVRDAVRAYEDVVRDGPEESVPNARGWIDELRERFHTYGVPPPAVDALAGEPDHLVPDQRFPVVAPMDGTLIAAPAVDEGAVVREGAPLFQVADLSVLWLHVELHEREFGLVAAGDAVEYSTWAAPDRPRFARVEFVEPLVRAGSRTTRARCAIDNGGGELGPGMSVAARVRVEVPGALAVPEGAVLQTGRRSVVLISEGDGRFRPREVELGRRHLAREGEHRRYHEVLSGLEPGEVVVATGAFLLRAEAQFQGALEKLAPPGATSSESAAGRAVAELVDAYGEVAGALVRDDLAAAGRAALALAERAEAGSPAELDGALGRLSGDARDLAGAADLDAARRAFAGMSREALALVRDHREDLVAGGELFVFRCPMADEFGFDLWLQRGRELQNPYMGRAMPRCGTPAELH